ncbi:MAG: response regulator transcription factor [Muricauda sp.]|jgi:DNA-binding NarL/FixJ family response regulator|nr:response regulator [Allomuricauda sp.]MBO6532185.1 response regulator transcription factor [Allomuricauda sp.]MBO6587849.1 response regulator transcription factor [Allomuricauda sp.]MBO6617474.1 response regulator transcription factor [Allomuricauda sp.]MBO6643515.1 response regulator transcription factor [Allomuricauda sp.]MBO6745809.1 response regulator transcription factor [Allomuricauda sp.]
MDYRGRRKGKDCLTERALQSILIVEDHQLSCQGFELIVEQAGCKGAIPKVTVQQAHSLKKAYQLLFKEAIHFDIVFLDICMPAYPEKNLYSGEDLGRLIVEKQLKTRILVMTSLTDKLRLEEILHTVKPHGFLVKGEVDEYHLITAIEHLLLDEYYYSPTIQRILQNPSEEAAHVDEEEKKFLYLLSQGIRNREIGGHLCWSLSKVEKRKRVLHKKLGIEKGNTMALVNRAKELGII